MDDSNSFEYNCRIGCFFLFEVFFLHLDDSPLLWNLNNIAQNSGWFDNLTEYSNLVQNLKYNSMV